MNTLVKIFLYLIKILNAWIFIIPSKLELVATIIYFGIMYLIFGTASMAELKYHVLEGNWFAQAAVWLLLGLPAFWGFASYMHDTSSVGGGVNNGLDQLIAHRNNMMNHAAPKDAYKIAKKTSHLDLINSGSSYKNAVLGFNATVGKDGPSKAYKDIMNS